MQRKLLHIALKEAIDQFGMEILTDVKLVNILLDYGAFADTPASKVILKEMIVGGYCRKICNLGKKKSFIFFSSNNTRVQKPDGEEWKNKLLSYSYTFSSDNGFERSLVNYVFDCVLFGLSWSEVVPKLKCTQLSSACNIEELPQIMSSGKNDNKKNSVSYDKIEDTQFLVMKVSPKNAYVYIDGKQQFVSDGKISWHGYHRLGQACSQICREAYLEI